MHVLDGHPFQLDTWMDIHNFTFLVGYMNRFLQCILVDIPFSWMNSLKLMQVLTWHPFQLDTWMNKKNIYFVPDSTFETLSVNTMEPKFLIEISYGNLKI